MTARIPTSLLLLALAAVAAACGGDDDIDCSYDDSCGGDPTGDWDIAGACSAPQEVEPIPECPQAIVTRTNAVSGSWNFQSDMDFSFEIDTTMIFSVRAPLSCLNDARQDDELPPYTTCEEASAESFICTTQTDVCDCRQISTSTAAQAGTWAAVESTLTLTDEFGSVFATYDFCREDEKSLKLVLNSFEEEPTILVLEQ